MINCKAIQDKSLFVTAGGKILPCCFMYSGGNNGLPKQLLHLIEDENFEKLVASWNTSEPYYACFITCDDKNTSHPLHMTQFENQWKNKEQ